MNKNKIRFFVFFILVLSLINGITTHALEPTLSEEERNLQKESQLIVQYNEDKDAGMRSALSVDPRIKNVTSIDTQTYIVQVDKNSNVDDVLKEYQKDPTVKSVEKNKKLKPHEAPNDTYYSYQWGFRSINAEKVWSLSSYSKRTVVVAVIDSGIDIDHPDLINRIAPGGKNFYDDNNNYDDTYGHGTAVSGVIAAQTNNAIGIAGVTGLFDVKILPLKTANSEGDSYVSDVIDAINYAKSLNVDVINLSMGSTQYGTAENAAIQSAVQAGITVVASAGNDGDSAYHYPASYNNVISVGAMDSSTTIAYYSSYNSAVDLAAPGSDIRSCKAGGTYASVYGTSFSAPMVSGLAALLKAISPTLTPSSIESLMRTTAVDKGTVGRDNFFGYGEIDVYAAMRKALNLPVVSVSLNKTTLDLVTGGSETLVASIDPPLALNPNIAWSSSNSAVATVDQLGIVSAVGVGSATITVTTLENNKKASCVVTVIPVPVTGVSLNKTTTSIIVGGTETLTATVYPANAANKTVSWSSSNPSVATVDQTGKITTVAGGTTTITVTTQDGNKTANCTVKVLCTISGRIKLPNGDVAPAGGLNVGVSLDPISSGSNQTIIVTIPAGSTEAQYSISYLQLATSQTYRLRYHLQYTDTIYAYGYVYYNTNGTTTNSGNATPIDISLPSQSGLDMTLVKGTIISGTISLPNGEVAPTGGMSIKVNLSAINSGSSKDVTVAIPVGSNSVAYAFNVLPSETTQNYRLSYYLVSSSTIYVSGTVYYTTSGTSTNSNNATPIDISLGDQSNYHITLMKYTMISGKVSLPNGGVAPTGGLSVQVYLSPISGGSSKNMAVTIPAGSNSADYSFAIIPSVTVQTYKVYCVLQTSGTIYTRAGTYYTTNGTTTNSADATPIDISLGSQSGLDMTLVKGTIISGNLSLPNGEVAPTGGLSIQVYLSPISTGAGENLTVKIPAGNNSASYFITLSPSQTAQNYRLYYSLQTSGTVYASGNLYYTSSGVTAYTAEAAPIDISIGDQSGFDITLVKSTIISGTISLPNGEVASNSMTVYVYFDLISSYDSRYVTVSIPAGSKSATYSFALTPSQTPRAYRLYYSLQSSGTTYAKENIYYTSSGTTVITSNATPIDISQGNQSGFDMTMVKCRTISGSISLPNNEVAPTGGIRVGVYLATISGGSSSDYAYVTIPAGSNSTTYSVLSKAAPIYKLCYVLQTSSTIYYSGTVYYTASGTTANSNNATSVDITLGDQSGFNITMLKNTVLSGSVSLPNGEVAPAGGLSVRVYVSPIDSGNSKNVTITIPAGSSLATYSLVLTPSETVQNYKVYCYLQTSSTIYITNNIYYTASGATMNSSNATPVDISLGDQSGLNMSLIKYTVISGSVSLPVGEVAPTGGLSIRVYLYPISGGSSNSVTVTIPAGSREAAYAISYTPTETSQTYRLYYSLQSSGTTYVSGNVYYTTTGATTNSSQATPIDISLGNQTFHMTLLNNKPSAPLVSADDIANIIIGLDLSVMEYAISTDGGITYGAYASSPQPALGGSKVVKIRIKAMSGKPAGTDAIFTFTTNFGDINNDGLVDMNDVSMVSEIAAGRVNYSSEQMIRANVSSKTDPTVDIADVAMMLARISKKTNLFPVELYPTTNYADLNGDGTVSVGDLVISTEIAVGFTDYTTEQIIKANVDNKTDPTVDIADVVLILERIANSNAIFPIEL